MTTKSRTNYQKTYTHPELREQLKEKIKHNDKGGAKGQWTARKAQLLKKEYEAAGGGYKNPNTRSNSQKSLAKWSKTHSD